MRGKTTAQMVAARPGALYVWCNWRLDYPKALAKHLGREDLEIVSPGYVMSYKWRGQWWDDIVFDHALNDSGISEEIEWLKTRKRPLGKRGLGEKEEEVVG